MQRQKHGRTADLEPGQLPEAACRTPFCALAQTALPLSDKPQTGLTTGLRRSTSSPLERSSVHRPMSAHPLSGTRGSRHHWAGPNADPIPEHEPVRPSGAAQALLAPVRKASCSCCTRPNFEATRHKPTGPFLQVYCSGDTSPRSPASPTLYESYLNSPIASMEAGLDRQDSSASTSESLEHCVRGGLPRLSSGLSSSCNSSCHGSVPRAK